MGGCVPLACSFSKSFSSSLFYSLTLSRAQICSLTNINDHLNNLCVEKCRKSSSLKWSLEERHQKRARSKSLSSSLSSPRQICTPDLVVFLACANHRLKERLEKRAEQQGRPDDNPKATERRLTNFKQNTIPLVKYFQERGPIATVTTTGKKETTALDCVCVCVCVFV